jgi:hypothetical protein
VTREELTRARKQFQRSVDHLGKIVGERMSRDEVTRELAQHERRLRAAILEEFERRSARGRWRRFVAWLRAPLRPGILLPLRLRVSVAARRLVRARPSAPQRVP